MGCSIRLNERKALAKYAELLNSLRGGIVPDAAKKHLGESR